MTQESPRGFERFLRGDLAALEPYEPIVPLEALSERSGVPIEKLIKLDGNENPYGCSPRVRRALADYPFYHIYPDPLQRELEAPLEQYVGISREHIVAGSGSDELIDLVLRLFLEPGDEVINCVPTFGMYSFSTEVCGGKTVAVQRDSAYEVDLDAVRSAVDERTKVVFIASPNNPSGNTAARDTILALVESGLVVVVDEAYYEFSGRTVAGLVPEHPNLIVLRTFSKGAGLGGLRAGYGIFPVSIAQLIRRIKTPYNVNAAAIIAMRESLADLDYLKGNVRAIIEERGRLSAMLERQGLLEPLPSEANFILCRVLNGVARDIKFGLEKKGIFIRYFRNALLKDMVRISVGKPQQNDALVEALADWKGV
jgi:histidinol-phosphate aminotransferase